MPSFNESYKGNSNNARIEKIIKKTNRQRHKFLKPKIIGKKLYKIKNNENPSKLEREEIEKYLTKLGKKLNKHKKYYFFMIIPYLRDMINNHKAPVKLKSLSGD